MGRGCLMTDSSIRQPISRQHLLFIPFVRDTFFYSVAHISFFFFFLPLSLLSNGIFLHIYALENTKKTMRFKFNVPLRHKRRRKKDRHFRKSMAPRNFFCLDLLRSRPVDNKRLGTERARASSIFCCVASAPRCCLFHIWQKRKLTSFFAHPSTPSKTKILKPETCVGSAFFISSSRANWIPLVTLCAPSFKYFEVLFFFFSHKTV